ncbi:hypothetical protein V8G54_027251, partial [Vigna mungo]
KSRTSISATETDVAVEEPGPPVADEDSGEISSNEIGISEDSSSKSDANPDTAKAKRSRPARKSEMPPVKNEDLIPGLSDSYVKDIASVVFVGQEVKVKLIEEKAGSGKRSNSKPSSRKDNVMKSTKLVIGQLLVGSVKNLARSGAFISLPEEEEGFLPVPEEPDDGFLFNPKSPN